MEESGERGRREKEGREEGKEEGRKKPRVVIEVSHGRFDPRRSVQVSENTVPSVALSTFAPSPVKPWPGVTASV